MGLGTARASATLQPMASDMRLLAAMLEIITELERGISPRAEDAVITAREWISTSYRFEVNPFSMVYWAQQ